MSELASEQTPQRFGAFVGFKRDECGNGICNIHLDIEPQHTQFQNNVHGGVIASLIDHCAGGAAMSLAPQGKAVVTADMHVNFLRPGQAPRLRALGRVVKNGRNLIVVQVEVFNNNGQMCALGTLNFALVDYDKGEHPIHFRLPDQPLDNQ